MPSRQTSWSPMKIFILVGSTFTPLRPTAAKILPQLGSAPAHAVFTRKECEIVRAMRSASSLVLACSMWSRITCCTPSPSDTICSASDRQTCKSASENFFETPESLHRTLLPPDARSKTESLVDVSPSIEMELNVESQESFKALRN